MNHNIHIEEVPSMRTAVVRRQAKVPELPRIIPQAIGEVWNFFRSSGLPRPGRNIAVYFDCIMNIECGVEVFAPFTGNDSVICSSTPAGKVVTGVHIGPYHRLSETHDAIHLWCRQNQIKLNGVSWELYGHWEEDEAKLRTDVYYSIT